MLYLSKCEPAISGQDGSAHTIRVAKAVILGFDLDASSALSAFRPWNSTCVPPWDEKELARKLAEVAKWPGERGNLLAKDGQEAFTPPPPSGSRAVQIPDKPRTPPALDGFRAPSLPELVQINYFRPFGIAGLTWAAQRGVLVVGLWRDFQTYGVTDGSGRVLEVRRIDGAPFPAMGPLPERKSHSLKGSEKAWPVGIAEAVDYSAIALLEGIPDFLVAHDLVIWEQGTRDTAGVKGAAPPCAPVAMLSASPAIAADALPFFKDKRVTIFAHAEAAGLAGAEKWRRQLLDAGVAICNLFDFSAWANQTGRHPNDLDEFMLTRDQWQPKTPFKDWAEGFKVMPC